MQTWWTSLSAASQLSLRIFQQVSKCQATSMLFHLQLLWGVDSVISTCGMCQSDQRARAKHSSTLKRSFITATWLPFSERDFCSMKPLNQTLQKCQPRVYGGLANRCTEGDLWVLTALRVAFPQLVERSMTVSFIVTRWGCQWKTLKADISGVSVRHIWLNICLS